MEKRYHLLDALRGITIISMVLYHGTWDLVYLFGENIHWYQSTVGYIWQQSICWAFILLSGFCWSLSKNHYKRGIIVVLCGLVITAITICFMPEQRVVFGVLTLIGCSMLLLAAFERFFNRIKAEIGIVLSLMVFFLTKNVNQGNLGFEKIQICPLPGELYRNLLTTFLGFPKRGFYSVDYFSLIPWFFLFLTGYYLYVFLNKKNAMGFLKTRKLRILSGIGRHSLLIYMLHQPALYLIFCAVLRN